MVKKVRIAIVTANLEINGISSVIMNYCRNIDLHKFDITIFAGNNINEIYVNECSNLGIKIVKLPSKKQERIKYYIYLLKRMKSKYFNIIHVHGNSATMFFELCIGFFKGIKKRIAHSHNTISENMILHKILLFPFKMVSTDFIACGKLAGDWIFGKDNYKIIPNGVDTLKFRFNQEIRKEVRQELMIKSDEILIGHIGRINDQKNQKFLIEIFEEIAKKNKKIKLLMVGTGPKYEDIRTNIENSKFKNNIILYGESDCPEKFYMAMDVFVFPSKYEGFPVTLLEAQISGLQCIISNVITSEVLLSNRVTKVKTLHDMRQWVDKIVKLKVLDRENFYEENENIIKKFEIKNCCKILEDYYISKS